MTLLPSSASARVCPNCGCAIEPAFHGHFWQIQPGGRHFGYGRCPQCGLVMAEPMPDADELTAYYATSFNYSLYSRRAWLKRIQGMVRWRQLASILKQKTAGQARLLDVGCGHGWFAHAAARDNLDVAGIDFPSEATRFARDRLGLSIIEADFLGADLAPSSYDIISMWHALEHMADPMAALERARELLKPNGTLVIGVPNVDSRGLGRVGVPWIWLQQPFVHLWHFSPSTLRSYLDRSGFVNVACSTRDTWDASYTYDAVVYPFCAKKVAQRASNLTGRIVRKLGGKAEPVEQATFFWIDESARLVAYGAQFLMHLVRPPPSPAGGSELLAIARKPHAASTVG